MRICRSSAPRACRKSSITGFTATRSSRFAGVWVGLKTMKDTVEATAVVDGRFDRMRFVEPEVRDARGGAEHPAGRSLDRAGRAAA